MHNTHRSKWKSMLKLLNILQLENNLLRLSIFFTVMHADDVVHDGDYLC
jgi:hypothetical protein